MIYSRLKAFRSHLGYNQTQMANLLGIKQPSYSELETGKSGLSQDVVSVLALKTDINLGWLFTGEGPMLATDDEAVWSDAFLSVSLPHGFEVDQAKVEQLVKIVLEYSRLPLVPSDFAYNLLWAMAERTLFENPKLNLQGEAIPVIASSLNTLIDLLQVTLTKILTKEKSVTIRIRGKAFVFAAQD